MKYVIPYAHIEENYVTDNTSLREFEKVRDCANRYKLVLSDEEFYQLLELHRSDVDIAWLMCSMSKCNQTFLESLIDYIIYY